MSSLSYYNGAFMLFLVSTINGPDCASAAITQPLQTLKNITKSAMGRISNLTPDFAPNGTLEKLIINISPSDKVALSALGSCRELFSLAIYNLNSSLPSSDIMSDDTLGISLAAGCAALSYLESCIDGFNSSAPQIHDSVSTRLNSSIVEIRKNIKVVFEMERCKKTTFAADHHHSFAQQYYSATTSDHRNPSWLSSEDSELIESAEIKPDIVVAQDGSGNYKTISEAVKAAPRESNTRFFIRVKKGVYFENVKIDADQWNVVMFGDGMDQTIVAAELSAAGGYDIFSSATFAVHGKMFIARDMGFLNKAGADKGQAVALLADSDRSVFYKCRIDGYQDALNANTGQQFYRECHIYGTIDFIFGGAAVVIQKSTIFAKRPAAGQGNAITAHARTEPSCRTGIVIQSSNITASEDLRGAMTTLGRPWKPYSAVVFMENYMESLISPVGWIPMDGKQPPDTVFLAEYMNSGPGSDVSGRVKWSGVRPNISSDEAKLYTVGSLLEGEKWIPSTNVTFDSGLRFSHL